MLFSKEIFDETVDPDMFNDNCRFIDISMLRNPDTFRNREDTMLRFFVLGCNMGISNTAAVRTMSTSTYNNNKKARTAYTSTYNRYFLVADLQNPPHCGAILSRSADESSRLLSFVNGGTFVGVPFCASEPLPSYQTLGDYLPILHLERSPFLPLKSTYDNLQSTESMMSLPTNVGEMNYFVLINKSIELHSINVSPEQCCVGVQCDRQKGKSGCTCLHSTNHNSSVYEFDVEFPVPEAIIRSKRNPNTTTAFSFRSLRSTEIFFQNFESYCTHHTITDQMKNKITLRAKFNDMVEYINTNGGWTIVGWFMMGSVVDAATYATEKVQNNDITIHLSYLYPTHSDTIFQDQEYKNKRIAG